MAYLYVTEQGAVLKKTGLRIVVEKDNETLLDIPVSKIEGVLIFGNVQFTTQALQLLLENGIEMAVLTSHGRLLGQITAPATKNIDLRRAQYARYGEDAFVRGLSRAVVLAKMQNGLELVREFSHNHPETELDPMVSRLKELSSRMESQAEQSELLGIEGLAARYYFEAFARMVRHTFRFEGRKRRPAPDPVNALLSLGYTLVYNEIGALLDGMGFDPYLGFFHKPHYGHATLASDMLEEFRSPLVDRFTLFLINNRILSQADFSFHAPSGGVYLGDASRGRYFREFDRFINRPMSTEEGEERSFRQLFRRQAERMREAVLSGQAYLPYRFIW